VKYFDNWNNQKKEVQVKKEIPYFYEREIWYIKMWLNIWFEQDWKGENFYRPLIILKKFNKDLFWWIPLTSINKDWKYYFGFIDSNNKKQIVILSQLKLYSSKRLVSKKWDISKIDFINLKEKIKSLID